VNRGNSGGPTFNLKGEVIGVNTAIYSPSGGSVGIAFDIPAATVASVIPQLQKSGHVTRGWLGVQIQPVTEEVADSLGLKAAVGALVAEPQPGSPAAAAGLKPGDVITSVDGVEVKDPRDLARRIASLGPNKSVDLRLSRNGAEHSIHLKLGQLADAQPRK
jgi:serine protease Do